MCVRERERERDRQTDTENVRVNTQSHIDNEVERRQVLVAVLLESFFTDLNATEVREIGTRPPPSLCLSLPRSLPPSLTRSLSHTHTLSLSHTHTRTG